jgi:mannose-6-phosphate isomerase-like protein (cupin superfamily)
MSYTIKNLRDTKDSAPQFGLAEIGEAHFPREELDAQATGLAYHVLAPSKRHPFGHRHNQAEEIYVILSGGGRMRLGDDTIDVGELDAIRVAPAVERGFEAGPHGMSMLVFGPHFEKDGELLRDFWGE